MTPGPRASIRIAVGDGRVPDRQQARHLHRVGRLFDAAVFGQVRPDAGDGAAVRCGQVRPLIHPATSARARISEKCGFGPFDGVLPLPRDRIARAIAEF